MNLMQFHLLRTAVQNNATPASARDVASVERALRSSLAASGLFVQVEVERTDDPDQLVIALCSFEPYHSEKEVAALVERVWAEQVSYPFWESHGTLVERGHVELEAASRPSPVGGYVTVHLVAQKALIPTQRHPSDMPTREAAGS